MWHREGVYAIEAVYTILYLLSLNGGGVLSAERELSEGHVVQDDVEVFGAVDELLPHQQAHLLPLGDQLRRVELGHHGLQYLEKRNARK